MPYTLRILDTDIVTETATCFCSASLFFWNYSRSC